MRRYENPDPHFQTIKSADQNEQRLLLKNAYVPLAFRLTIMAFSTAALGISATIYEAINRVNNDSDTTNQCASIPSTYMAIAVGSIALPYIGYVTSDEYMSKPYPSPFPIQTTDYRKWSASPVFSSWRCLSCPALSSFFQAAKPHAP